MKSVICFKNGTSKPVEINGLKSVFNNAKTYNEKKIRTDFQLAPNSNVLFVGEKESLATNTADILYVFFVED